PLSGQGDSAGMAAAEVTAVLARLDRGERAAAAELLPLVYDELRRLARGRLARLPPGQTLQATALVHEAYVGLVGGGDPGFSGRAHFFGAAARAMHDIVVDRARRKAAQKRGGGLARSDVDEVSVELAGGVPADDVLALAEAFARLEREHPERAEIARLKTFVGLGEAEIAELLGLSVRTVERHWRFARAFLARDLAP
ncbi:MAG TPA: ECF-type sigma factor, partial [Minicystis sp.]|nr:ECF-type sigma factor [Minicystis sp.]